jgi:ribosome-binding protein aMBF1 (putative translation factor)
MKAKHVFRKNTQTPAERAREKAIRERFQREKPSLDDLLAQGDCRPADVMTMGEYFAVTEALTQLRKARQQAGLSLADVSQLSGIDKGVLSKLETGKQPNPTVSTLIRYASALGRQLVFSLRKGPAAGEDLGAGAKPTHRPARKKV